MNISASGQMLSQVLRGLSPVPTREPAGAGIVDTSVEKDPPSSSQSQSETALDSRGRPVPTPAQEQLDRQQISQ